MINSVQKCVDSNDVRIQEIANIFNSNKTTAIKWSELKNMFDELHSEIANLNLQNIKLKEDVRIFNLVRTLLK